MSYIYSNGLNFSFFRKLPHPLTMREETAEVDRLGVEPVKKYSIYRMLQKRYTKGGFDQARVTFYSRV
ncbi:unnamed protein product, partial [Plutella xylostella]